MSTTCLPCVKDYQRHLIENVSTLKITLLLDLSAESKLHLDYGVLPNNCEVWFGEMVNGEMKLSVFGQIAQREWDRLPQRFKHIKLGAFVIMPDHVHGITIIHDGRGTADFFQAR